MFRINFYCEDKNLAKVKRALASVGAFDVTDQPMPETTNANGKVFTTKVSGLSTGASVIARSLNGTMFTAQKAKAALTAAGMSANNYSPAIRECMRAGFLRKSKLRGHYIIQRKPK